MNTNEFSKKEKRKTFSAIYWNYKVLNSIFIFKKVTPQLFTQFDTVAFMSTALSSISNKSRVIQADMIV